MKISIACDSILLQKTLESYLKEHLVSKEYAELIMSDKKISSFKPIFLVNQSRKSELRVPFTKKELFWALEEFYILMLDKDIALKSRDQIKPFIHKINKKHNQKIASLAKKII